MRVVRPAIIVLCVPSPVVRDWHVQITKGGADSWENLVACCLRCNNAKSDRTPGEMGWSLRTKPRMPYGPTWAVRGAERALPSWDQYLAPAAA